MGREGSASGGGVQLHPAAAAAAAAGGGGADGLVQQRCKVFACGIQRCLRVNGGQEARCKEIIQAWRQCKAEVEKSQLH
jgi:hypothetical protein